MVLDCWLFPALETKQNGAVCVVDIGLEQPAESEIHLECNFYIISSGLLFFNARRVQMAKIQHKGQERHFKEEKKKKSSCINFQQCCVALVL